MYMVGAPSVGVAWLHQAGGMSAEAIGSLEGRVHRPFMGRSTPPPPAFAAIIIKDPVPRPQTAHHTPGIQDIAPDAAGST
jgi:hypothetical protein